MKLNFSNNEFKNKAILDSNKINTYNFQHTNEEAFLVLIKDVESENLDNFCKYLCEKYDNSLNSLDYYEIIQSNNIPDFLKNNLIASAYECIDKYGNLGNKTIMEGKINTSSWISHSLYEAKVARNLANNLNLNTYIAFQMGLLHDIGRKQSHSFDHVIKGYEYLASIGWNEEAISCLTHSFLKEFTSNSKKGGRFANCDPAEDGFNVDENLIPYYSESYEKDDVSEFLENYNYSIYDVILNISDLIATDKGVVSPYERVEDIYTRKKPDERNRTYFLNNFIHTLLYYLKLAGIIEDYPNMTTNDLDKSEENFTLISDIFNNYCNILEINKKNNFLK